jgi:hypothetical protein
MYNGVKVLDVHSHIRWHRTAPTFMNSLMSSNTALASPIAGGKSSEMSGYTDEEFAGAAERHAKYLDDRNIDIQILGPHPVEVNGWMEPHIFNSWTMYVNDAIHKICQARPDLAESEPEALPAKTWIPVKAELAPPHGFRQAEVMMLTEHRRLLATSSP